MTKHGRKLKVVPTQKTRSRSEEQYAIDCQKRKTHAGYRAFRVLQFAFIITPIVAGTDKFFHILVDWDQYLSPMARHAMGPNFHIFMRAAGVGEILLGFGMIFRPKLFSNFVSAWLLSIVINLLLTGTFFDIALRDFVLILASLALGPLSEAFSSQSEPKP